VIGREEREHAVGTRRAIDAAAKATAAAVSRPSG
jgi:hypothetical protein